MTFSVISGNHIQAEIQVHIMGRVLINMILNICLEQFYMWYTKDFLLIVRDLRSTKFHVPFLRMGKRFHISAELLTSVSMQLRNADRPTEICPSFFKTTRNAVELNLRFPHCDSVFTRTTDNDSENNPKLHPPETVNFNLLTSDTWFVASKSHTILQVRLRSRRRAFESPKEEWRIACSKSTINKDGRDSFMGCLRSSRKRASRPHSCPHSLYLFEVLHQLYRECLSSLEVWNAIASLFLPDAQSLL